MGSKIFGDKVSTTLEFNKSIIPFALVGYEAGY